MTRAERDLDMRLSAKRQRGNRQARLARILAREAALEEQAALAEERQAWVRARSDRVSQ